MAYAPLVEAVCSSQRYHLLLALDAPVEIALRLLALVDVIPRTSPLNLNGSVLGEETVVKPILHRNWIAMMVVAAYLDVPGDFSNH
jgi:hypothetical protein